jgi:cytidyltransferase-like protein
MARGITVLAFGTFDKLHEGHRNFFREARRYGDRIIAAVAQDEIVAQLKKRFPQQNLQERMKGLEGIADVVVAGDAGLGEYAVVKLHRPDIIALGYDQTALKKDLEDRLASFDWEIKIVVIEPYQPETYHSSLLRERKA